MQSEKDSKDELFTSEDNFCDKFIRIQHAIVA